jgi:nicotinamidase-related amidase
MMSKAESMAREESRERAYLRRVADPAATAVLTMELQNGIVGEEALFPLLVEEVGRLGILDNVSRICGAARQRGARVVHCTKVTRPDGAGQALNCKVFALSAKLRAERGRDATEVGTAGARLVEGLLDPRDFEVSRLHGMTPFTSTSLDQILRNLGVRTVIATGVSVNLGIFGMSLSAVDLGYQVVIARDAVAGVPAAYAQSVIDQSLSLIATVVTTEDILAVWDAAQG